MTTADRPTVEVTRGGIVIRASLDVSEQDLLEAAMAAHRKAQRQISPTVREYGLEMGYRAHGARLRGVTWRRITADLAEQLGRPELEERQVQRWVNRWEKLVAQITDAYNAGQFEEDTSD